MAFQGITVLDGISLDIYQGEFAFLVGESGAGKSTLVKILIREEEPTDGEIYLEGESVLDIPKEMVHVVRRKIGVVFQDFKLLDSRTVFENVAIALAVVKAPQEEINEIVPNVLNMVGLLDKKDNYPYQLSGGEKQRVAIARALAHEPDILVADEPTGMIDPKAGERIMEILEDVVEYGTTVLMTTHDQDIVNRMKKRVIRIHGGKIISDKQEGGYND
ncbi:ATP-binding cassette domain-containing protein [candidate division WWE3 bacterium]|nr:ATP-binding cassette domain-containing protein [candidate division WWE3 bacterium]